MVSQVPVTSTAKWHSAPPTTNRQPREPSEPGPRWLSEGSCHEDLNTRRVGGQWLALTGRRETEPLVGQPGLVRPICDRRVDTGCAAVNGPPDGGITQLNRQRSAARHQVC